MRFYDVAERKVAGLTSDSEATHVLPLRLQRDNAVNMSCSRVTPISATPRPDIWHLVCNIVCLSKHRDCRGVSSVGVTCLASYHVENLVLAVHDDQNETRS